MAVPERQPWQPEPTKSRKVRTLALVGGLVAIVGGSVAVGGGWLAFSRLNGGGPQPESVLPSDTVAFAKVDLNPSAGQKVAAVRFALRFPDAKGKVTESSDLRKVAFEQLQEKGHLKDVDYAADVEPWLGDRFGVGLLPGAGAKDRPIAVAVLAVTDEARARESLPRITESSDTTCGVRDDFAICSEDTTVVALLTETEQPSTLADSQDFADDMSALGEDGSPRPGSTSSGWATWRMPPGSAPDCSAPRCPTPRVAVAWRWPSGSPGRTSSWPAAWPTCRWPGRSSAVAGRASPTCRRTPSAPSASTARASRSGPAGVRQPSSRRSSRRRKGAGRLPSAGPLRGDRRPPHRRLWRRGHRREMRAALVTGGDPAVVKRFVDGLNGGPTGLPTLHQAEVSGRPVVATSDDYAREIASRKGLGGNDAFREAVPGATDARAVLYLDLAGLLREHGKDLDAKDRSRYEPFSALGVSTRGEGTTAEFTVRSDDSVVP